MLKENECAGAIIAILLALAGWLQSAARSTARIAGFKEDVDELRRKTDAFVAKDEFRETMTRVTCEIQAARRAFSGDIAEIKALIAEMDRRRETAREEFFEFRERMAGEIGAIRGALEENWGRTKIND